MEIWQTRHAQNVITNHLWRQRIDKQPQRSRYTAAPRVVSQGWFDGFAKPRPLPVPRPRQDHYSGGTTCLTFNTSIAACPKRPAFGNWVISAVTTKTLSWHRTTTRPVSPLISKASSETTFTTLGTHFTLSIDATCIANAADAGVAAKTICLYLNEVRSTIEIGKPSSAVLATQTTFITPDISAAASATSSHRSPTIRTCTSLDVINASSTAAVTTWCVDSERTPPSCSATTRTDTTPPVLSIIKWHHLQTGKALHAATQNKQSHLKNPSKRQKTQPITANFTIRFIKKRQSFIQ